jgi:hypothetical protein
MRGWDLCLFARQSVVDPDATFLHSFHLSYVSNWTSPPTLEGSHFLQIHARSQPWSQINHTVPPGACKLKEVLPAMVAAV